MAGELFKSMAGVYLVHIPYRGSTGARTDLIGGQGAVPLVMTPEVFDEYARNDMTKWSRLIQSSGIKAD